MDQDGRLMTLSDEDIGGVAFRWEIRNGVFQGEILNPDRKVMNHILGHINDRFLLAFDGSRKTIAIGSIQMSSSRPLTEVPFIEE